MSGSKIKPEGACALPRRNRKPTRISGSAVRSRTLKALCALVIAATAGCNEFHLSTSNLQITPVPARAGETVVASFLLSMIPFQKHTMIVFIDDMEYLRITKDGRPDIPVVIDLGDAGNMIARFGTGVHVARIEVRADEDNESTRTAPVSFELADTAS